MKEEILVMVADIPRRPVMVTVVSAAENYGRFAIGPLEDGYGTTFGNALRRVLLSSIPGAAVTKVKIEHVTHEFAALPGVREDVTEIVLNLKGVRLRSFSERAVRAVLIKQGTGPVRAGDIDAPSTIEIVNPQHYLCTVDGADDHSGPALEIELTVERGKGFLRADGRDAPAIGEILVDAIFSPIPKVNFVVERDGMDERLVLEIWTDGTTKPGDALSYAAQLLTAYFTSVAGFGQIAAQDERSLTDVPRIPADIYDQPIEDLDLTTRTFNALRRADITKVGQILDLMRDPRGLLGIRNLGAKSVEEIQEKIATRGLLPEASS